LPLREIALGDTDPVHRTTALWTLDGMGALDERTLRTAMSDKNPKVRANAIRLSEANPSIADATQKLADDPDPEVRRQFVLSFGRASEDTVARIMSQERDAAEANLRDALVSGLNGVEVQWLRRRLDDPAWQAKSPGRWDVLTDVARSVTRRDDAKDVAALVELIGQQPASRSWQQLAMIEAIPEARHDEYGSRKLISATTSRRRSMGWRRRTFPPSVRVRRRSRRCSTGPANRLRPDRNLSR
jgi:hypothetical protein